MRDRRPLEQRSKRLCALKLSNILFRIYFDLNTLGLCKNLVAILEQQQLLSATAFSHFALSDRVAYKYFVGKLDLLSGDHRKAHTALRYAYTHCPPQRSLHRRLVLHYLAPTELLQGRALRPAMVRARYGMALEPLIALSEAVRVGNVRALEATLLRYERWLIARGIFLVAESLRLYAYRNLLKRMYASMLESLTTSIALIYCPIVTCC